MNRSGTDSCYDSVDQDCNGTVDDGCRSYTEHCGTISASETWSGADVHVITCDVGVAGSAAPVLKVEDGATLEFNAGIAFSVGSSTWGGLVVEGDALGVTFTSADPTPAPGDWDGILVGSYARAVSIDGAVVLYAGGTGHGGVYLDDNAGSGTGASITDSLIAYSATSGVHMSSGARADITGTTVSDNTEYGLYLDDTSALSRSGTASFTDNVVTANGYEPIYLSANHADTLDASSTYSGNGTDRLYVNGDTVDVDSTWQALDVPWYIARDVTVQASTAPRLTIEPGTTVSFGRGAGLLVASSNYGSLYAVGTATDDIVFTSGQASPAAGDWNGITIGTRDNGSTLQNTTVEYGGANAKGNVYFYSASSSSVVADSTIAYSSSWGIYRVSSTPTISNVAYLGNASGELY